MNADQEKEIHYRLLKVLHNGGDITQRGMARQMGISVGKVNYCLKELVKKGFVKIRHFQASRNKIQYLYILTPTGIEERARLAGAFLKRKMQEYEEIRRQIKELTIEVRKPHTLSESKPGPGESTPLGS